MFSMPFKDVTIYCWYFVSYWNQFGYLLATVLVLLVPVSFKNCNSRVQLNYTFHTVSHLH